MLLQSVAREIKMTVACLENSMHEMFTTYSVHTFISES